MKISVDIEVCVGSGQCALFAPSIFALDEDNGHVLLLESTPPAADEDDVRDAAYGCPARAIQVEESKNGPA
jgi:ferredoxin